MVYLEFTANVCTCEARSISYTISSRYTSTFKWHYIILLNPTATFGSICHSRAIRLA